MLHRIALFMALVVLAGGVPAEQKFDAQGPAKVNLSQNLGTLELPKGYGWMGEANAKAIIEADHGDAEHVIGAIVPTTEGDDFWVEVEYEAQGYVEDKDAGKLDNDAILKSYQEGTEAGNEQRKAAGQPGLHVTGWEQKPSYDAKKHVVVWSLQGEDDSKRQLVNYNTRVLTRKGVLSFNLICDNAELKEARPKAQRLLGGLAFNQGERYEDYQKGDKISAGGLAALIVGGAVLAKKTGVLVFLAYLFKPLLLFFKALGAKAIAVLAVGLVWIKNKFSGRSAE